MGIVGNLVGIGFFGLVVLIALFYIPDLFGGLFDATGELYQLYSMHQILSLNEYHTHSKQ